MAKSSIQHFRPGWNEHCKGMLHLVYTFIINILLHNIINNS